MQRLPNSLVENLQLPIAYPAVGAAPYVTPANTRTTLSHATLNNTTAAAVTVSVSVVPSGQTQANANEIITNMSVPASGSAPTTVPGLIGRTLMPGTVLLLKASAANAITVAISGYETTL